MRGKPGGQGLGPGRFDVGDDQAPGSGAEEPEGHCRAGSSRSELHHRVGHGRRKAGPEAADESGVVRVVAHGLAVVKGDGVDGTKDPGIGRKLIQAVLHELLARVGDVQSVESEISCMPHQGRGPFCRLSDGVQIDDAVGVGKAQPVGFGLVEARGERSADTGAEQAHHEPMAHIGFPRPAGPGARQGLLAHARAVSATAPEASSAARDCRAAGSGVTDDAV